MKRALKPPKIPKYRDSVIVSKSGPMKRALKHETCLEDDSTHESQSPAQ